MSDNALQQHLSVFILEVRKTDGTEYPPQTLHHIVCELMRHNRRNGGKPDINVFQDRAFADFRKTLNAEMKRLKQTGLGSQAKQAEPLAEAEEKILWEKGIIGDHSPQALLNAVSS